MDFLNVGSGEVLFIVLLALLLIGPKRAVEFVLQIRRLAVPLLKEWRQVQGEVIAEVNAIRQETMGSMGKEIQTLQQDLNEEIQALQQETLGDSRVSGPSDGDTP